MPDYDIVCIGQNAVDTLVLADRYPAYGGKERFREELQSPGGQVATAAVACARLGMRTKYIGTTGDDARAQVQRASLAAEGIDITSLIERRGCATQTAYIVIDRSTGERTVLWRRDAGLGLRAEEIQPEWLTGAGMVHLDGGDLPAITKVAAMARAMGIPVSLDADTHYEKLGELFANVDYLIAAQGLLERWTREPDGEAAIRRVQREYGCRAVGITLGNQGAILLADGLCHRSSAYAVDCTDTTGAGDVFHGAFCYSVLNAMPWDQALDFANAMAALNCQALGARGHIASLGEVREFMRTAMRIEAAR